MVGLIDCFRGNSLSEMTRPLLCPSVTAVAYLCLPDSPNALGQSNIVRLQLIKCIQHDAGETFEQPAEELERLWCSEHRKVVDDTTPGSVSTCDGGESVKSREKNTNSLTESPCDNVR